MADMPAVGIKQLDERGRGLAKKQERFHGVSECKEDDMVWSPTNPLPRTHDAGPGNGGNLLAEVITSLGFHAERVQGILQQ